MDNFIEKLGFCKSNSNENNELLAQCINNYLTLIPMFLNCGMISNNIEALSFCLANKLMKNIFIVLFKKSNKVVGQNMTQESLIQFIFVYKELLEKTIAVGWSYPKNVVSIALEAFEDITKKIRIERENK